MSESKGETGNITSGNEACEGGLCVATSKGRRYLSFGVVSGKVH